MIRQKQSWDLIVVGAGSAGAAIAARSAERGHNVLLLEAGPDYRSADMDVVWRSPNPLRALQDPAKSRDLLWTGLRATRTDAQEARLYWRGRGVGGSSAINGQIAIRPPREDFDDWAADGCQSWSWDEVLPYFCRLETDLDFGSLPYHGSTGPTTVWRMSRAEWGSVDTALAQAATIAGFPWSADVNAPGATGVSPYPINSRDRRRVSTNDAYLEQTRDLERLSIVGGAVAERVLFDHCRAIGVAVIRGGRRRHEFAEEAVLSARRTHTPGILIRSGIGPSQLLEKLGIGVVADLPVGQGLQDHPVLQIRLALRPDAAIASVDDRHTNCCIRYDSSDPDGSIADMMIASNNQALLAMESAATAIGVGALCMWLNRPIARGSVTLTSQDPDAQPTVRERMLSDQRDLRRMRHGARLLAELAVSDPVGNITDVSPQATNRALWDALEEPSVLDPSICFGSSPTPSTQQARAAGRPESSNDGCRSPVPRARAEPPPGCGRVDLPYLPGR